MEMFSVNFCDLRFFKLCHDSLENVAGIDTFKVVSSLGAKERIFSHNIQNLSILRVTS